MPFLFYGCRHLLIEIDKKCFMYVHWFTLGTEASVWIRLSIELYFSELRVPVDTDPSLLSWLWIALFGKRQAWKFVYQVSTEVQSERQVSSFPAK